MLNRICFGLRRRTGVERRPRSVPAGRCRYPPPPPPPPPCQSIFMLPAQLQKERILGNGDDCCKQLSRFYNKTITCQNGCNIMLSHLPTSA